MTMKHLLLTTIAAVLVVGTAFADPIHDAARDGDLAGVQAELGKGVDVNAKDGFGRTPLYFAADRGRKQVAELLITEGADVNVNARNGFTPLHRAAYQGHKEIAELLIDNGADVNAKRNNGSTPLHKAAENGQKEIAELLIAEGADMNANTDNGETPLDIAIKYKRTETADLLRKHGGNKGEELRALLVAAGNGHLEVVKQSIADGIDVNTKDNNGTTPLHNAARRGHKEIAELLIANGADVNATDKQDAETPLHWAAYAGENHIVELLIKSGAGLNPKRNIALHSKDRLGATPLDHALNRKKYDTVDLLRKYGGRTGPEDIAYQFESINNTIALFQHLIIGDAGGDTTDKPSIEKLQGVFVIQGKIGGRYEVQYHTGDNKWQMREVVTLQSNRQLYIDSSSYDEKRLYRVKVVE
jgi:ankyrin repeat protein